MTLVPFVSSHFLGEYLEKYIRKQMQLSCSLFLECEPLAFEKFTRLSPCSDKAEIFWCCHLEKEEYELFLSVSSVL